MSDKYEQLKQKIEEIKTKSLVAEEMKAFVALVLKIVKETKDDLKDTFKENLKTIAEAVKYVEQEHDKVLNSVSQETKSAKTDFAKQVKELKELAEQVKAMKPQDGKDADEDKIVEEVLNRIELPEYKETILDGRKEIVEKINTGGKKDIKIDLSQIEGLEKSNGLLTDSIINRAIGIVDQRTSFLLNKINNLPSSGGGTWGSITGTLSDQTDLQSALDGKASSTAYTLAGVSALSTDATKSLYTMSTNVDVEFEDDGGNTVLYLDESTARVGIGTTSPGGKLEVASGTLTTSAPILLTQTWNAAAIFEGIKIAITQTATGSSGSTLFSILGGTLGTTPYLSIDRTGYTLLSNSVTGQYTALLLRNSHAAANDTVDIDFEITTANPLARIGAIRTNRAVSGDTDLTFSTFSNGSLTQKWKITDQGNLLASTDNTYDIGASGATRPRALYLAGAFTNPALSTSGTNATFNGNVATIGGGQYAFASRGQLTAPSNGVWKISDSTDADFNRLQLGGTSSSYPSIKRNGTALNFRLADDSGDSGITAAGAVLSGDLGLTGTRVPKGWFTDIESTNMPTVGGTALDDTLKDGGTYEIDVAELGSGAATDGQVATADGSGGVAWETPGGGGDDPVFYPVGESINRNIGGTITEGGSSAQDFIGVKKYPDSTNNAIIFNCKVPNGKTGITSIKLVIQGDNTGGNAYLGFVTYKIDVVSGGAVQGDTTQTKTAFAITANTETQLLTLPSDSYNALTSITSDKVITVDATRFAADALDTHNTTLEVVGLMIDWS